PVRERDDRADAQPRAPRVLPQRARPDQERHDEEAQREPRVLPPDVEPARPERQERPRGGAREREEQRRRDDEGAPDAAHGRASAPGAGGRARGGTSGPRGFACGGVVQRTIDSARPRRATASAGAGSTRANFTR